MANNKLSRKEKIALLNGIAAGEIDVNEIKELGPLVITDMIITNGNWRMSSKTGREWYTDSEGNEITNDKKD